MPPIDWERLMVTNVDDMEEDEAEKLFENLAEFDPGEEDDPARLRKLFRITRTVMEFKGAQAQVAEEELDKEIKKGASSGAKREQDLLDEIDELKSEVKNLKRYGGDGGGSRDTRILRDEIHELERQNELLEKECKELERHLNNEKRSAESNVHKLDDLEKELRSVKRERDQLSDDVRDYQRQMESQRESLLMRRGEDVEYRDKMTKKNRELIEALEEVQNLTEANNDLQAKSEDMRVKLEDAVRQMDKTTEDYIKLKTVLQQSDSVLDNLRKENESLKAQVADLTDQVSSKADADDEIMVAVNEKVQEWKATLAEKDEEIAECHEEMMKLKSQLIAATMDSEKASVAVLSKAVEERDKQIEMLQSKLDQAISDIETQTALIEDLKIEMGKGGHGPSERQAKKIQELQGTIRINEEHLKDYESRAGQAEKDAREKDRELSEALERMRQYEAGEYGLSDAVAEIKELKLQIGVRDKQIVDLTQHINKLELKMNDLWEENEDLRERLGLDAKEPIDLKQFRQTRTLKQQEDRALNAVLQKEVERLEEERVELKKQIRKLAQQTGQRAVALGLTADDMMAIEHFTEDLKSKRQLGTAVKQIKEEAKQDEMMLRNVQLDKELERAQKELEKSRQQNAEMKAKLSNLTEENTNLEVAMKQIAQQLKEHNEDKEGHSAGDTYYIQCPSLERMLAAIEAKNLMGKYDTSLHMKAQVDNLQGRNDELRRELREARFEAAKANSSLEKAQERVAKLENDMKLLRDAGAGAGMLQTMALPEGMAATSADVIASLNEHLVQTLQELTLKEEMIVKMEASLESYKRKFAVMRHQQGLVYQDYMREKKTWDEDRKKLEEENKKIVGQNSEDKVRLNEYDRLLETLSKDDVEVRRRVADQTRKITVLRVNEKALTRRYNSMVEGEGFLRKENTKLKNDMIAMETAVTERLGYLQRFKDMAAFKIAALQKALDDSVPMAELEAANKQYNELTEKYRDILERGNTLVAQSESTAALENDVKRLKHINEDLLKEMEIEKEKLHTLEAAMEDLQKQGITGGRGITDSGFISISKKITTLEMKELNERQRAEHSHRMYEQQKQAMKELEDRNVELEQKFIEITKMNLEAQKVERELRDELANCVMKSVSEADRKRIAELEKSEAYLKNENSRLKEIAEVGSTQAQAFEAQQISRDKELQSLRQQLADIQAQSDEKTVIGKLHRHIVQLQVSEGTAVRRLEQADKKIKKLTAQVLRLEHRLDEKDTTIYHNRQEARNKSKHLKRTIQELRRQFSGAVPLTRQEKFAKAMVQLHEDKTRIEQQLREVNEQRDKVEDKLAELELQHKSLQDLMVTLKDGKGAQKVVEWHGKMEALRLEELKQKRQNSRLHEQIRYLEKLNRGHETTIAELEEESVKTSKHYEERQLQWEQREVELERIISSMEKQQAEIAGAASKFEEASGILPDPSLPVASQLDHAIATIKNNVRTIIETQAESKVLKRRVEELQVAFREAESNVISRDKVIAELRVRLPATAERDEMILKATSQATEAAMHDDYETAQALKIAQSTIQSLQARIAQKEETIQKYQDMLRQTRDDMQEQHRQHEEEMKSLQLKLHSKHDDAFSKFKQAAIDIVNKPSQPLPTNKQLARLNELEETVVEQDNAMGALTEKLKNAQRQIEKWKLKFDNEVKTTTKEKENMLEEHLNVVDKMNKEIDDYKQRLSEQEQEMNVLQQELESQKEANARAPTVTMKNLVERLKNQLAVKEKQHQALSKALVELRSDMVTQAQEQVKANAEEQTAELNVQKVVEKHTKQLKDQIEDLESQVSRAKKDLKKRKDKENVLNTELEETKSDLHKKESQVRKLKEDKQKLEHEVEELEKKIERLNASKKPEGGDVKQMEVEELRRKTKLLEEELRRTKHQPEKPYDQTVAKQPEKEKSDDMVARWEESKKWQRTVDRLKGKLKDKEIECERLERQNEMTKTALDRANRDKESLESRLRSAGRSTSAFGPPGGGRSTHNLEELRRRNYDLEEQVTTLKRQLTQGKDAAFEEVQLRNKFLSEKLEELERTLARKTITGQGPGPGSDAYQQLYEKEQKLQKQVLKMSEENIELRFEAEQAKKDIPRLKERIEDLQNYVEVLKAENATSARSLGSSSGNIKRIGESGKSTRELEKTIALLKKVVERTQAENDQLKRAPGVVSNEQLQLLQLENEGLKDQLEELRQKMGATLAERYNSTQKGTTKIMVDYERLRKDLRKESDANEKLKIEKNNLKTENENLRRELEEKTEKLKIEEAKRPSLQSLDSKGWKSVVVTRMYEEKLKGLEGEMEKKNQQLTDMKQLLKDAAEREQSWLYEKERLEEKIAVLEKFPGGANIKDADVMKAYQQSRLTIDRLEKEKAELLHELKLFGQNPVGEKVTEETIAKMRHYDKTLRESVEIRTQLKSVEFDRDKLQMEVEKLRKELSNFGPEFFEEIEDLKYNYREAVQRNIRYEDQLRHLSEQFGVTVDIPGE